VDADAITLFNTHLSQGIGHPMNPLSELPEGYFGTIKIGGWFVGETVGRNVQ
jgi:hypothetical protein